MELIIENSSESSINNDDELEAFKEKWSKRNTDSVQEITLQHMETKPSKDSETHPTITDHTAIFDDFKKVPTKK